MRNTKFTVKLQRPVCRTPIKPMQKHKPVVVNARKEKHKQNYMIFSNLEA